MSTRPALERALATRMSPVARAWQKLADHALSSMGVSNSNGWALTHLDRLGPDARQSDLARTIGITEASLVRTLHQLEHAGLLTRTTDTEDRRANKLRLTDEGKAMARKIETRLAALRTELLEGIPSEDLERVVRVLDIAGARMTQRFGRR